MHTSRHLYKPIPQKNSDQSENIPLRKVNKKPLRRICKWPDFDGQLEASHPRFGPFYREGESEVIGKKEAWEKIFGTSGDNNKTFESYSSAMKSIEKVARDAYGDRVLQNFTPEPREFRRMMIEDGCLFLQLALLILGVSSQELDYPEGHAIFGQAQSMNNTKMWIESMFFVGNQIPLVVLKKLLKQEFFQNILKEHVKHVNSWKPPEVSKRILYELQTFFQKILKNHVNRWDVPSEVSKRILYDLLVLPAIENSKHGTSPSPRKGCGRKVNWLVEQDPSDLLHALHCLMFGSGGALVQDEAGDDDLKSSPNMESKDGESDPNIESKGKAGANVESKAGESGPNTESDVESKAGESGPNTESKAMADVESKDGKSGKAEANMESTDRDADLESGPNMASKDTTLSATVLKKKGIRFGKSERMGCREIVFRDYILLPRLYLPTFAVDDDTEALWKSLKYYEMTQQQKSLKTQQQGNGNCEVRSYLQFMNDLICTNDDVRLLANKGIIKEHSSYDKYELPNILSRLAGKEKITTQKHRLLRIQLRDYGLAPWERFKTLAILILILTAIQTIFTVLAFFRSPLQK